MVRYQRTLEPKGTLRGRGERGGGGGVWRGLGGDKVATNARTKGPPEGFCGEASKERGMGLDSFYSFYSF